MLQLTVNYLPLPLPRRSFDWEVRAKQNDEGAVIGYGPSPVEAIEDFLYKYESKHDIAIQDIKYKWS